MAVRKNIKIILINLIVFLFLILIIETSSMFLRILLKKEYVGWLYNLPRSELSNFCLQMETHPFLSHHPKHENKCSLKFGEINGQFIDYPSPVNFSNEVTVALGGSTTTGFYEEINDGFSWPFFLSKNLASHGEKVINGGIGGYSVVQEMFKIITEVSRLPYDVTRIISLSGINDIEGYQASNSELSKVQPFMTYVQMNMLLNQKWVVQDKPNFIYRILPNTKTLIMRISRIVFGDVDPSKTKIVPDKNVKIESNNLMINYKEFDNVQRWLFSIEVSNQVAEILGARYYLFLQPTMGLIGVQSEDANPGSMDSKILSKLLKNSEYLNKLNKDYSKMRDYCSKLPYCFDISNIAVPSGNNYHDPRHHNMNGNKIISNEIFEIIKTVEKKY